MKTYKYAKVNTYASGDILCVVYNALKMTERASKTRGRFSEAAVGGQDIQGLYTMFSGRTHITL